MPAPAVAILDLPNATGPAGLRWHDPGAHAPSHILPGVRGFSYHQVTKEDGQPDAVTGAEPGLRRPIARSVHRVRSLARFLGTNQLQLGDGVYCEVIASPSVNVSAFAPVCAGSRRYHVLMMGADSLPTAVTSFGAVNFVTGSCLFSDRAVRLLGDAGTSFSCLRPGAGAIDGPVRRIEFSPSLTLYELESACRLPWLTASMIALLPPGIPVSVTLDMPRVQYYLYLLSAFERGLVSRELMLCWFELVDERSAQVSALAEGQLADAHSDELPGRPIRIGQAPGMSCLEPAIRRSVRNRTALRLADMAGILSANDPVWDMAIATANPQSHRELINLSYAVEQLRCGLAPRGEQARLGIMIDNPGERRVGTQARVLAGAAGQGGRRGASLLGLYPLERAFTSEATGPSDLYYHDPGHTFTDPDGREHGTAELLARLYPDLLRAPHAASRSQPIVAAARPQSPDVAGLDSQPPQDCVPGRALSGR